ncbi:transglutaminase domain-containing protein [Methanobrevibacter olleyae]|uniref:Adhesin-like protein with transglutaminase domain protein n=1 Tax=Methanobrevibacter olleyae TaxID=294671 RepID=A0A126R1R0_METOL|nr:transglutaminase domain-containing protein [Methanobrevibacter olleyae]AMK15555.1 adhesin-like protein with transglutaminase domain protein [Methanobrevibacter olleyae]
MVGVKIKYKFIFSLLLLIFILSVSAVSAEFIDNDNSSNLQDNDEFSDLSDNINNLDNMGAVESDYLMSGSGELIGNTNDKGNSNELIGNTNEDNSFNENIVYEGNNNISNDGIDDGSDGTDDINNDTNETENTTLKNTTLTIISQDNWKIYGEKDYIVKLLDEENNPVVNAFIKFKIKTPKGTYIDNYGLTNEEGIAILTLNLNLRGIHNIQVSYDGDSDYNPAESVDSNVLFYEKTSIKTPVKYAYRSCNFIIKLVSSKGVLLSNKKVVIYVDGVKYTRTTDSKGQVYIEMPSYKKSIKLNCTFSSSDYYESSTLYMVLPVYKKTYTKALVYTILKGKYFKILLKGSDGKILKKEKVKFTINGKTYTKTTNDKGIAYLKVSLNRSVYKVYFSYDNNGIYGPSTNSSNLEIIDPSGQFKKGLNRNTKFSVGKYLSGGGRATITKSIRKLSKKITSKYSTKLEKATAIFNYVRDNLGYSYYANSRKGAAKTLKTKKGNCCDHSNLIVALCRASNIPARYSHARGCKFKSGIVTGHVWAQIYVGGRWYSADATSYRNSLGHIKNWNTKSYHSYHSYRKIPF